MERIAHKTDDGGLIDTVSYTKQDIDALAKYCEAKRASGQHKADDVYELATVPGEFIEAWCFHRGISFARFSVDPTIQTEFINSEFAKPFRVWQGTF